MSKSAAFKLAGAAALAGSTQAYGQVILMTPSMLPSNIPGGPPQTNTSETYDVTAGVTNGGSPDFTFQYVNSSFVYAGTTYYNFSTYISNLKAKSAIASTFNGPFLYADALAVGTKIGIDTPLQFNQPNTSYTYTSPTTGLPVTRAINPVTYLTYTFDGGSSGGEQQQPNSPYYIGFQFTDGVDGKIHDGWLELESNTYTDPGNPGGLIFLGGAYNSVADTGDGAGDILVGEVPEPGTISSLVLGAAALVGVGLMRRRRAALAAAQD
jgi:hypothetical protein